MPASGDLFARRYRLVRILGRGAMGVVHEAVHEQLGHRVAIKVLRHADGDDEHARRRFEREARLAAKLTSPHVVKVSDVDHTEDGTPYLVMELLEGHDLAHEVEEREKDGGTIAIAEALSWVIAICDAMETAHAAGVVHRDLKLSNVFLTNDGIVKILDFGVASFRGGDAESSATASVAGTPRYMAPEQLLGEAPNPASDVWATGVILYRLLTRRFPYDAPTMAAQMLAIMDGEKRIEDLAPRVPKDLATVVHRALGRTLEERWPSMNELRARLLPFTDASPELALPPADEERTSPPEATRRPRASWRLVLGALAVMAILVVLARRTSVPLETAPSQTTRSAPRASAPNVAPSTSAVPVTSVSASVSAEPKTPIALPRSTNIAPRPSATTSTSRPVGDGFPNHL
jgi:serine/threonine protein kinase